MFFLLIAFIFLPCLLSASDTNELSLDKESLEQEIQALKKNYEQLDKTMSGQDGNARIKGADESYHPPVLLFCLIA